MTDIERTLKTITDAITKDVLEVDREEIKTAWREYASFWPDPGKAMSHFQNTLLAMIIMEHGKSNESAVILGQYMKNLSWALQKKQVKSEKDSFLKIPKN